MKRRPRPVVILAALFIYVLLQFIWWEVLLVRQTADIISEKEKIMALGSADAASLDEGLEELRRKKAARIVMIVGEGTVFLLILLFGVNKIRQAYAKEESLNRRQKNFFLSITHELKTPIAATKLQLQTLQKQVLDGPAREGLVKNALEETERLSLLIDKVLLASSLESGAHVFHLREDDLGEFVGQACARYYQHAIASGMLVTQIQNDVRCRFDRDAFLSVVTNLVDNAIKYGKPPVTVTVQKEAGGAALRVADGGEGIPAAERGQIFSRFYRSGNEATRRAKGTGLGLYIVDYIVRRHNGEINVITNQPSGAIFEVKLNA
jgi:signal transduction histidine kinase